MAKMEKPSSRKGLARLWRATGYSLSGLRACFTSEAAFRQESVIFLILLPVIALLPVTSGFKIVLLAVDTLVLIIELLNSAIEATVDCASPAYHDLAKKAKDMGSGAVLLSLLLALVAWGTAIGMVLAG